MATTQTATGGSPAFEQALSQFRAALGKDDLEDFRCTTLEDLQRAVLDIQSKHAAPRKLKNMTRLSGFLEAMKQFGNVVEVFLNVSEILAFVWVSFQLAA